jgi:hypothetical protein
MRREYLLVLLSDPTAILGDIRTTNFFGLKSKFRFSSDRFRHNLHRFWRKSWESHLLYYSDHAGMWREIGTNLFRPPVLCGVFYCPISTKLAVIVRMLTHFQVECISHYAAMQCESGRKSISPSRVKCPSFLTDFDQTFIDCGGMYVMPLVTLQWTRWNVRRNRNRKTASVTRV